MSSARPRARARTGRTVVDMEHVIVTHGLERRFGARAAVSEIDLVVPSACCFGLLGPNGAGKTTLIRLLLGLLEPSGGRATLLGHPLPEGRRDALSRVGALVEEPRFHGHLTGRENLRVHAAARGVEASARIPPRSSASVSSTARTSACGDTRWGCASASRSRAACSPIRCC